jgi:LmbE family N-acetylglucosaminyl deacetylase
VRVLCVAAHPDDEVLGPGGTLLRHKAEGDEVAVVLTAECRVAGTVESHEAEARMGIEYHRHWDTDLVETVVKSFAPDIVYTHWRGDLNRDHREIHERVLVACRPQSGVREVYAFDTASSTEWGIEPFVPDHFVDITETIDDKLYAMEAYASELRPYPHPRNIERLTERAAYWGQVAGVNRAEAFKTIRRVR